MARTYDALLLDLDGTLVGATDDIEPELVERIHAARERGAAVLIATGRSQHGTRGIARTLGLNGPQTVYNGAAVWDPERDELIEERVLSNRCVERMLRAAEELGAHVVVQRREGYCTLEPPTPELRDGLRFMEEIAIVDELPTEYMIRAALFFRGGDPSEHMGAVDQALSLPAYFTSFHLSDLAMHRGSEVTVVDVHPPCRGKAEALRVVEEHLGIAPERVVAVGDASNDVPLLQEAGLGVAVATATSAALAAADRVLETPGAAGLGALVDELFG